MTKVNVIILPNKNLFETELDEIHDLEEFENKVKEISGIDENLLFFSCGKLCSYDDIVEISMSENKTLFGIKKSVNPLKRKMADEELSDILDTGLFYKKLRNESDSRGPVFNTPTVNNIKSVVDNKIESSPSNIEQIIAQPQVQLLMENSFIAPSLLNASSKFQINPLKARALTDKSQFQWLKNTFNDSNINMNSLFDNYSYQLNQINSSTRMVKITDLYNKISESSNEQNGVDGFSNFIKSQYGTEMMDLLSENKDYSESVLKLCPYGPNLLKDEKSEIQAMYPEISKLYKDALTHSGNNEIMKYLQDNPIEMDDETAERLSRATSTVNMGDIKTENEVKECGDHVSSLVMKTLEYLSNKQNTENLEVENKETKYSEQFKQLQEMGFVENDAGVPEDIYNILESELGSVERCVMRLIQ